MALLKKNTSEAEAYNQAGDKAAAEGRHNSAEMFYDMAAAEQTAADRAARSKSPRGWTPRLTHKPRPPRLEAPKLAAAAGFHAPEGRAAMTADNTKVTVSWHSGITRTRVTERFDAPEGAARMVDVLKDQPGLRASDIRVNGKRGAR